MRRGHKMKKLDQKVAIVTGAAQGIGRAIAGELALAGAHIAVFDLNIDAAHAAAAEISKLGVTSKGYAVDVSKSKVVDDAFSQVVSDFGRLDILVNNAGVSFVGPHIKDVTDEVWDISLGVMQSGVFTACVQQRDISFHKDLEVLSISPLLEALPQTQEELPTAQPKRQ